MKFRWDNKYLHWGVTAFLVIAASMLFYYGIFHMGTLISGIKTFFGIMAPILYGVAIAYLLSSVVNFMEQKLIFPILEKKEVHLKKRGHRVVRWICVLLSLTLFMFLIYALIMMILPQLIRSIVNIITSFPYYVSVVENWLNSFVEKGWDMNAEAIEMLTLYSNQAQEYLTTNILPQMQEMLKNVSAGVFDVLGFLKDFLIGTIVSLYVLADKEVFVAKGKMVVYALLPTSAANTVVRAMRFTHKTFGGFISGKILDSAIIGVLCYIGCTFLDMPYTILISVIVGVTNIIPFFGPFLGAIPCFFLILLVSPLKSLYFIIFVLVLQQFDGNILGPKILGDSTGLSSFMVIVAIMIGGGLFSFVGMVAGVPICAVIYAAVWNLLGHSLKDKKMSAETEDYFNVDCMDPETHEPIPFQEKEEKKPANQTDEERPDGVFMKIYHGLEKIFLSVLSFLAKQGRKFMKWTKEQKKKLEQKKKDKEQ